MTQTSVFSISMATLGKYECCECLSCRLGFTIVTTSSFLWFTFWCTIMVRVEKGAKLQNTPQLWSASLTCVGRLWRSRHNTIDAILIQWHVNELRGILKLLRKRSLFLWDTYDSESTWMIWKLFHNNDVGILETSVKEDEETPTTLDSKHRQIHDRYDSLT